MNTHWGGMSPPARVRAHPVRDTYYIIVVEKDEGLYAKIVSALEKVGGHHNVRRVSSQEELDEELVRLAPDFVICTQSRSPWNSYAVLDQVRAFESTLPFAIICGGAEQEETDGAAAAGVDACLDCDHLAELVPTLEELLKRRTERQRHSVEEIRRSLLSRPRWSRRAAGRVVPFAAG